MTLYKSVLDTIGRTPLVRVKNIIDAPAEVYAKLEYRNPLASVKDRIGLSLIEAAEREGKITPETMLIEPTSGNTGIALAFVCAAKGYHLTLTMPETMSIERRKILAALGAELVLSPAAKGIPGAIEEAEKLASSTASSLILQQFSNPANPEVHRQTTGPEIWEDSDGTADILVAGVGTGGTITGTGEYLKSQKPEFQCWAVEPDTSPVITQMREGKPVQPGKHGIQGIGAGFVPDNLNMDIVDGVCRVSTEDAYAWSRLAAKEEGIFCGISSGAALCAAYQLAQVPENKGKKIVAILASAGDRYLSTPLFDLSS